TKYVGGERQEEGFEISDSGLNQMDKTLCVGGAHIAYRIWEVAGDETSQNHIPSACKDSVTMLFMFDLTSRCTLNSIVGWDQESRKWNQVPMLRFTTSWDLFRENFNLVYIIIK
ncbi:septum-promoting GTP-binding protein 1-like, partial [Camellia sinensis]|uniref:septum-promoting GTP-binding protein 1-like n=1 Tax=Camellia sinensis TaxID=4442 RepID=UPI00103582C5